MNTGHNKDFLLTWEHVGLTLRWDIALLRLSSDATLNNYVQLGALPPSGQVLPHNNPCYISGWGRTQSESVNNITSQSNARNWCYYLGLNYSHVMSFSCCPQLEVSYPLSWSRLACLSLTTRPALVTDGGAAPWRAPWSAPVVAVNLDAR